MIVGIGIDILAASKLEKGIRKDAYLRKVFTPDEIAECRRAKNALERFAGKFVVKEAFMKAIGAGIRQRVWFTDIEVLKQQTGQPRIKAAKRAEQILRDLKVTRIHVSISHNAGLAVGVVILEA